jgi:uncharacterized membrane protein
MSADDEAVPLRPGRAMSQVVCAYCSREVPPDARRCPACAGVVLIGVPDASEVSRVHWGYVLLAASSFFVVTPLGVPVLAALFGPAVRGTWLHSHWRWQLLTVVATVVLVPVTLIAGLAWSLSHDNPWGFLWFTGPVAAWFIFRTVYGWVRLVRGKPAYQVGVLTL